MQLDDGQQFWADCVVVPAASRLDAAAVFDPIQAANQVHQLVQPLWQNQSAAAFRPLAQQLSGLVESFRYVRPVQPRPHKPLGALSRRSLLSGFFAEEASLPMPKEEMVEIERPLHPALQYGLTAALLQAVASANRLPVAALVAKEFGVAVPETAVPLQIALNDATIQTARSILTSHVASVGYTTSKNNHKETLGAAGERLQQHVRQVAGWLPTVDASFTPTIFLDLQGGFGDLFNNNPGKILGALFGLEQAAKPFCLLVQNPIWLASKAEQLDQLKTLKSYLSIRRMQLKLVADAWVDSLADAELFANADSCHMVHLALPRLGNLDAGITAVLHLLANKHEVLLSGETTPLTTHIALAARPTLLSGPPQLHYNQTQQFLALS